MRSRHRIARSPYPNPNTSTDALVSLAWTGEFPSQSSPVEPPKTSIGDTFFHSSMGIASTSLRSGWKSTWSLSGSADDDEDGSPDCLQTLGVQAQLPRRPRDPKHGHRRRWTLAMAIMDDGISDETLLDELEKMRTVEKMWQSEWRRPPGRNEDDIQAPLKPSLPCLSDPALSAVWQSARLRTERHYLLGLRTLASSETLTTPPPLMLTYLPALVEVSETLMTGMERNPSAQGVANAFLSVADQLEAAFISWCGVVGGFFVDSGSSSKRERANSASPSQNAAADGKSIKRRVNSWGKRIHSIRALTSSNPSTPTHGVHKQRRGPAVRDLAILPTQRIMRYTLLFKDLFSHTPIDNASASDVEKALKAAMSIAQKCDRAQDNAAFLNKSA
ncbi:hypothetical protein CPB85DRAFT_1324908 [Mucidula mucida]|nr:hypothetical protein CPB85DRAFT_1324908 [Mucidula mucida]